MTEAPGHASPWPTHDLDTLSFGTLDASDPGADVAHPDCPRHILFMILLLVVKDRSYGVRFELTEDVLAAWYAVDGKWSELVPPPAIFSAPLRYEIHALTRPASPRAKPRWPWQSRRAGLPPDPGFVLRFDEREARFRVWSRPVAGGEHFLMEVVWNAIEWADTQRVCRRWFGSCPDQLWLPGFDPTTPEGS